MFPDFWNTCHSTPSHSCKYFFSNLRRLCLIFQGFQNNNIGILLLCFMVVWRLQETMQLSQNCGVVLALLFNLVGESKICGFRNVQGVTRKKTFRMTLCCLGSKGLLILPQLKCGHQVPTTPFSSRLILKVVKVTRLAYSDYSCVHAKNCLKRYGRWHFLPKTPSWSRIKQLDSI